MESATSRRPTATGPHAAAAVGRNFEGVEAMPAPETRDWSELHVDALSLVFTKLGTIEVLMGAGLVCRSWLHTAKLPHLWRSVDMSDHRVLDEMEDSVLCAMAKVAVDRSCGQLETFVGKRFVTDDLFKHIGDRAPSLKKLCLISCYVTNEGITAAIKKFPLLEDLELSFCKGIKGMHVFEYIGKSCTRLTHFKKCEYMDNYILFANCIDTKDMEAMGIAAMTKLRSLQLFGNIFGNKGLMAVLDNCPNLESLDIRQCFNVIMGNELQEKLARIKTLRLPKDSTVGYEYPMLRTFSFLSMESVIDYDETYDLVYGYNDAAYMDSSD